MVSSIKFGGISSQNYMNACRGAEIAYQNALRWKIEGKREHADCSVRVLMSWARGNKYVRGDMKISLADGLTSTNLCKLQSSCATMTIGKKKNSRSSSDMCSSRGILSRALSSEAGTLSNW